MCGSSTAVPQGEGCEQGDALAPALFALGQHEALCQAASALHRDNALLAFLDDLEVVTVPERAREALDSTTRAVENHCGIASNFGKTRVYALEGGPPLPGIAELGDAVWWGDKPPAARGLVVLCTPIGHPDLVCVWAVERMQEERKLLQQLPELPDLQCSWLLLAMCASPRANHALRSLPPSESRGYAAAHDEAVWETLHCLGGLLLDDAPHAWPIASLPAVLGGRTCPAWRALLEGARPPPADDVGPGDWPHGWQMHATRTLNPLPR